MRRKAKKKQAEAEAKAEMELLDLEAKVAKMLSASKMKRRTERLVAGLENPLIATIQNAW